MITTPHIIRLLGAFMAPEPPPVDRHEVRTRATREALLNLVGAYPKGFQEIAAEHGDITADMVRNHMRELAALGQVVITKEPVTTSRGNTVSRHVVKRVMND